MARVSGKTAVVTGAASGIGFGLAQRLTEEGASVVLVDLPGEQLEEAAARVGGRAVAADVSKEDDVLAVRDAVGPVDVLCNNAGVMGPIADPLWELPFAEWERVLRVNLWGVLHGVRAFVPEMVASGRECYVLNTASMQGVTTESTTIPEYTISKHGVVALTEILRNQLRARDANVHVSVLLPGGVSTGLAAREHARIGDSLLTKPNVIPPDLTQPSEVARIAIDALLAKRFWIFSHDGSYERVRARIDDLLSAFED